MEVEVRRVPGIKDCYAALPLALIQALQAGSNDAALSYVVLELRQKDKDPWYLAWAGAASSSPTAIEVSKKLAECIGLPDGARVFVKAQTHVAHAKTVVLEPATEDDWEILELNAGFVEDHILSQVGVLCSGQLFPIRVQGENILTLHVISTLPKQVVRLVPGSELIVAPKPRKKLPQRPSRTKANGDASLVESSTIKAWLRVQDIEISLAQTVESEECLFSIVPTTSIFVSPETARNIGFINGQLVVIAPPDGQGAKQKADSEKKQNQKSSAKPAGKMDDHKRHIVLRLVYCSKVTRGHTMIASTLRLFIGAAIHTYIEVRSVTETPCPLYPRVILSPLDFKVEEAVSGDSSINNHIKNEAKDDTSYLGNNIQESEKHQQFLSTAASLTDVSKGMGKLSESVKANILFKSWATAELAAVSQGSSGYCSSIPISKESVMQFCIRPTKDTFFFSHNYNQSSLLTSSKKLKKENFRVLSFLISLQRQEPSERVDLQASMAESPKSFEGLFLLDKELMDKDGSNAEMPGKYLNVIIGEPRQIASSFKKDLEENMVPSLDSLKWLKGPALQALKRLQVLLSTEAQEKRQKMGLASPGYVLLHGPAASGKSRLALALARELEEDRSILAHKIMVKCRELGGEQVQTVRTAFQDTVCEALRHAPSLIILDDLDALIPSNTNSQDNEPSSTTATLTEFLSDLLDTFQVWGRNQHGGAVVFLAVAQAVSSLPPSLCSSGRFDFHVELPAPAASERAAILHQELDQRNLVCQQHIISEIASKCEGYDTADLEVLVDRAVHVAARRLLPLLQQTTVTMENDGSVKKNYSIVEGMLEAGNILQNKNQALQNRSELLEEDFAEAIKDFYPVSMRDVAKPTDQVKLGWEDVGGLSDTCRVLQEVLELPVKYSKIFSNAPLRLRSGVLLYGPPGCGKTHIVGVAAAACSLRLISVKGPELLNKYIGASEQGVRDIFAKARAAAPCILFFDEFDAIAPKRGHDNTGVTDRVVNQLLTELDGVEALNGVFVFAATSRPELLDAALLRPGRLDRLLLCDLPTAKERLEILKVLSKQLPLAEDVDLYWVASQTENYSGADMQAILIDSQVEAVRNCRDGKSERPIISMDILESVLAKARASVSKEERNRLHKVYEAFMSSRSSIAKKARDIKGKRATLA